MRQRPLSPPTPSGTEAPWALPTWRQSRRQVSRTGGGGGGRVGATLWPPGPSKQEGFANRGGGQPRLCPIHSQQCGEPEDGSDARHEIQTAGQATVRLRLQWCVTPQRGGAPATRLTMADWATKAMATRTATRSHPTATAKDKSAKAMATVVHATASVGGHDSQRGTHGNDRSSHKCAPHVMGGIPAGTVNQRHGYESDHSGDCRRGRGCQHWGVCVGGGRSERGGGRGVGGDGG